MRALVSLLLAAATVIARPHRDALCSYGTSNYSLSWTFDELSNDVVFRLTATSPAKNFWTGVYFGEEEPFDAIGVFVRNGQIGLVDAHLPPSDDATVVADDSTNVQSLQFDMVEGRLTAEFARPLATADKQDSDLSKCATFFFPEAEEITKTGQITLPNMSMSRRVCDIARNCPIRRRHSQDQFKREEKKADAEAAAAPVAEEPVAAVEEKALEKKETIDAPICSWSHEGSNVSWRLEGDNVIFNVDQPNKKGKWYSAFGIGESMENLRAVVVFTENGKFKKIGAFKTEGYAAPDGIEYEPLLASSGNAKGRSFFEFSASKQKVFADIDFSGCVTLQLGLYLGNYGNGFKIQKHKHIPTPISVCGFNKCGAEKAELVAEAEASGLEIEEGSGDAEAAAAAAPNTPKENEDGLLFNPFKIDAPEKVPEEKIVEAPVEEKKEEPAEDKKAEEPAADEKKAEELAASEKKAEEPTDEQKKDEEKKEEVEGSGETLEDVMNATPKPEANKELEEAAATTIAAPVISGGCSSEHKDLKVCSSYFTDYLDKVGEWAKNHEQTIGSQMWKACTLLSEVKHVPTMCCTIFRETCSEHLKL